MRISVTVHDIGEALIEATALDQARALDEFGKCLKRRYNLPHRKCDSTLIGYNKSCEHIAESLGEEGVKLIKTINKYLK